MTERSQDLCALALRIWWAGVAAADPARAVRAHLRLDGQRLVLGEGRAEIVAAAAGLPRVHLIAVGKAAPAMLAAARAIVPGAWQAGPPLCVTDAANRAPSPGAERHAAGHPVPDAAGLAAARALIARLDAAGEGEHVLLLLSGGASAMLPAPAGGITLADKAAVTGLLLASGADIHEFNTVRKHLSRLKGGQLLRHAAPARVWTLVLSDVADDDLATIASGPTVPDPSTYADAVAVLQARGIWARVPDAVRAHLRAGTRGEWPETVKPGDPLVTGAPVQLVGGNRHSVEAMARAARAMGWMVQQRDGLLVGEAREAAARLVQQLLRAEHQADVLVGSGETTVTVRGQGKGGRNQEFALAFALEAEYQGLPPGWCLLAAGSDGRDGPTDAAGGCVDAGTLVRIRAAGADPAALLADNDAWTALGLAGDRIITGATGTNVADLLVVVRGPG